jgi:5-formyltetrahydrofolate cyclo-ligase
MDRKRELRTEILKTRSALGPAEVARASAAVTRRVLDLPAFRESRALLAYVDVRNEVRTGALIRAALAGGKRVAVPVTDRERRELTPALIGIYPEGLTPGAYGIPEPRNYEEIPLGELDCILIPGVAYDYQGYRLGFGGGYYDRFLPRVRHHAVLIGLAYDFQVCRTVYPEPHDQPVHFVVTERRILCLATGAPGWKGGWRRGGKMG